MTLPVIILGAGGHARVLVEALRRQEVAIEGCTAVAAPERLPDGIRFLGGDEAVFARDPGTIRLVNGIGSVRNSERRGAVFEQCRERGFRFASVFHPSAVVAADVALAEGAQLMAGAIVQPGAEVRDNVIVNTGARIDHDCILEAHVHVAPGAVLSGGVHVGRGAHIGTGAVIIQGIRIGENALVAAGAVVVRDVPDHARVKGNPAREY